MNLEFLFWEKDRDKGDKKRNKNRTSLLFRVHRFGHEVLTQVTQGHRRNCYTRTNQSVSVETLFECVYK
ncbi:hypothetical protein LEP1GSC083_2019 [Leptospira interrogans serovar Pyrogenes str. L0374]|uniref:Uncharacterized protein n=1 Tax=Leptospira interrogans serovar Pyrogenes str. L0374 TaxID=1049928 RepID=M6KA05_LEPIR|nr:hypothetical protein LEP1GSC099_1744 [Leptospira interrogans str. UI 08452]EMN30971.1 hypothetical protein LEP1GSC083_2019 [Leptospira interrogans serovar Pyrogenes str. L0374]EMN94768.1 hypothetical protein LEP1GSC110_3387 [Leptospira interrogans serovar Medanensis str. UT053]EMO02038.1 hypothetical protein LEP1GSC112_0310 [Leptospira interrogans serovar Pomona str. UT364]EMO94831.1 hypothetical protein LEP1GSC109_3268 [Leptospira interrogans str. UI 13372]